MEKYNYTVNESDNVSFGGTTENQIYYVTTTTDLPLTYEAPIAGSLDTTKTNKK
jgi:hypothetical protein